jgi:choline dehydrogenase-like flavoprotein
VGAGACGGLVAKELAARGFSVTVLEAGRRFVPATDLANSEANGAPRLRAFHDRKRPRTGQHGADCFHCHGGPLFTDHQFHDNGLDPQPPNPDPLVNLRPEGRAPSSGAGLPSHDP